VAEGSRVLISGPHEASTGAALERMRRAGAQEGQLAAVVADNSDPDTPDRLLAAATAHFGRLDGTLVSVGGTEPGTVATTTDDAWRSAFESVFLGGVRLTRTLGSYLGSDSRGGGDSSIVFVLASSVRVPLAELAISNGLFPGLAGIVKMLADELGPAGTRVNGLLPVRIATDRLRAIDSLSGDPDEVRARRSQEIPLRRYGEPEEFGRVAAFLLSPAASYVTGAMIPVDGGSIRAI
jgi:3-oxoacyl-[acyl-carrier protein] reductase